MFNASGMPIDEVGSAATVTPGPASSSSTTLPVKKARVAVRVANLVEVAAKAAQELVDNTLRLRTNPILREVGRKALAVEPKFPMSLCGR